MAGSSCASAQSPQEESLTTYPRSPWRTDDGELPEAALRGEVLFDQSGCATCHTGTELTDSAWVDGAPLLHDVGTLTEASGQRRGETLTGLDTPGLRGLHDTAPYLHDGSASTIAEAILAMPETEHLSDTELEELSLYLLCLE